MTASALLFQVVLHLIIAQGTVIDRGQVPDVGGESAIGDNDHHSIPTIKRSPMILNGEPVEGSDYPWKVSLRAEYPDYEVQANSSNCSWIRNSFNWFNSEYAGYASSPEDCIQMVHEYCPSATMASIHEDAFEGESSFCYCQWGSNRTLDAHSGYYSCFFENMTLSLGANEDHHRQRLCGGSLIHKDPIVIMTAASCFDRFFEGPGDAIFDVNFDNTTLYADLGRTKGPHYGNQYDESGDVWTEILISNFSFIHIHPQYDFWAPAHDIALVVVNDGQSLPSNYEVATIPDHISRSSECCDDNETLTVLGYGLQLDQQTASETMGKMSMAFISMEECRHLVDEHGWWYPDGFGQQNDRVCALTGNSTAGLCTEFEDGGGPLFRINDDGDVEVTALFAPSLSYWFPSHCDLDSSDDPALASPSLFTSVAHYNAWISSVINQFDDSWIVPDTESPTPSPTGPTSWLWTTSDDHNYINTADCEWVRNDANYDWVQYLGYTDSPDHCIQMSRDMCFLGNIANVPQEMFQGQNTSCYCQSGSDRTPQPSSQYFSCFYAEESDLDEVLLALGTILAIAGGCCCLSICACIAGCVWCGYCCGQNSRRNRNQQRDQVGGSRPEGMAKAAPMAMAAYPAVAQVQTN